MGSELIKIYLMELGRVFKQESSLFREKKPLKFLAYVHNWWPVKYILKIEDQAALNRRTLHKCSIITASRLSSKTNRTSLKKKRKKWCSQSLLLYLSCAVELWPNYSRTSHHTEVYHSTLKVTTPKLIPIWPMSKNLVIIVKMLSGATGTLSNGIGECCHMWISDVPAARQLVHLSV